MNFNEDIDGVLCHVSSYTSKTLCSQNDELALSLSKRLNSTKTATLLTEF